MIYVYILAGAFLVVYFGAIIFLFLKRRKGGLSSKDQSYIHSNWYRILDSFDHDPKHAILDADKLLDYCLGKRIGAKYERASLGEKLKNGKAYFSDLDGVWSAHKLRNRIAHELNLSISSGDAKRALSNFKRALVDLGAKI